MPADAGGRDLIISLQDKDAIRLERLPVEGGDPQPIKLQDDLRIPGTCLTSSMVGPGGRIVAEIASPAEWAYRIGMIDPHGGKLSLIPVNFEGETLAPIWTRAGKLVSMGSVMGFSIWRFHGAK
jgi:hypothetical protein